MQSIMKTLADCKTGETVTVVAVTAASGGSGLLHRRILDMGIVPGTCIRLRKQAPLGDPVEIVLRGYALTLRKKDAETIIISEQEQ